MERYYVTDCVPGYTGHIPQKLNTYATSTGRINRELMKGEKTKTTTPQERLYYTKSVPHMINDGDKIKYGFRSRYGKSWIMGPTNKVYEQQIPCNEGDNCSVSRIRSVSYGRKYHGKVLCEMHKGSYSR